MSDLREKDFEVAIYKCIERKKEIMIKEVIESMKTKSHQTENISKKN